LIQRLKKKGWLVELIYLALSSVEMCRLRVAERVSHGRHDIPQTDIERRRRPCFKGLNMHIERLKIKDFRK